MVVLLENDNINFLFNESVLYQIKYYLKSGGVETDQVYVLSEFGNNLFVQEKGMGPMSIMMNTIEAKYTISKNEIFKVDILGS